MRDQGRLVEWFDEKGYGFIQPDDAEKERKSLKDKLVFDTIYYRKLIYEIYNRKDNGFFLPPSGKGK